MTFLYWADVPTSRELALDALQDAADRPAPSQEPVPCQTLTRPGDLCSTCWTGHEDATTGRTAA